MDGLNRVVTPHHCTVFVSPYLHEELSTFVSRLDVERDDAIGQGARSFMRGVKQIGRNVMARTICTESEAL
jgi:hypothetical protein